MLYFPGLTIQVYISMKARLWVLFKRYMKFLYILETQSKMPWTGIPREKGKYQIFECLQLCVPEVDMDIKLYNQVPQHLYHPQAHHSNTRLISTYT